MEGRVFLHSVCVVIFKGPNSNTGKTTLRHRAHEVVKSGVSECHRYTQRLRFSVFLYMRSV